MTEDNVIYTNGRDVTITDSVFEVGKMKYRLNGITKYGFSILKPERLPSILLLILSILLMVSGFLNTFPNPDGLYQSFNDDGYYGANLIAIWGGGFLAVVAILLLVIMRERYSVRISTAEGEKDAVVSPRKEYISQVVEALNKAFNRVYPYNRRVKVKRELLKTKQ
ncbi:MAG: hypothetical protein KDC93_08425 [Cyclobacteriaceae bacterium]|nr:hypothetical protein [Cyclobacteriaceae bacterium]